MLVVAIVDNDSGGGKKAWSFFFENGLKTMSVYNVFKVDVCTSFLSVFQSLIFFDNVFATVVRDLWIIFKGNRRNYQIGYKSTKGCKQS